MGEPQIHERALCESQDIGFDTNIEAFARVKRGASIGRECNIGDGAVIGDGVAIGDRVTIGAQVVLAGNVTVENDVVIGDGSTFTTGTADSTHGQVADGRCYVRNGARLGAGTTVLGGVEVGRGAEVAAGSVVTRSVPPHVLAAGNPCQMVGYRGAGAVVDAVPEGITETSVPGVTVQRFREFTDFRGSLTAGEMPSEALPFVPCRWFLVYGVPNRELRGEHAHRECHQFLMCVAGSVAVAVDDGEHRAEVLLDRPTIGIHIPPMVWGSQFRYEPETVLLVLASHAYDTDDYVRDYEEYRRLRMAHSR